MNDKITIQTFGISLHKLQIGLILVITDALSLLLMYFIFGRMRPIIDEYLQIIDNNMIKYSDFSFQIQDIELDEAMQDQRVIKMKFWVHLSNVLKHVKTDSGERLEIIDIQLSF